jgi:hypothetical protein
LIASPGKEILPLLEASRLTSSLNLLFPVSVVASGVKNPDCGAKLSGDF